MKNKITIAALTVLGAFAASADNTVFQASLTPDIAICPRTTEVDGLSLSIWGENPQHGVALGLINGSSGDSCGFTWGLVNYDDSYTGVMWGCVNVSRTRFIGWQHGWVNVAQGKFIGFQSGWINYAEDCQGFQLGLINYSENLRGLQVGLANFAINNQWFNDFPDKLATGFPIVNWSF